MEERKTKDEDFLVVRIWEYNEKQDCSICFSKFSLIKQRHHCRLDGIIICDECSKKCFFNLYGKIVRLCMLCAAKIGSFPKHLLQSNPLILTLKINVQRK